MRAPVTARLHAHSRERKQAGAYGSRGLHLRSLPLAAIVGLLLTSLASADPAALGKILDGVSTIAAPGTPGNVCVFGPHAFVIADGKGSGRTRVPVIGAATFEKGKVVVFGHDAYLSAVQSQGDTPKLMVNLIRWAGGENAPVGVVGGKNLAEGLVKLGIKAEVVNREAIARPGDFRVLIIASGPRAEDVVPLTDFVRKGGAAFVAHTGWGWASLNPEKSLRDDLPLNRFAGPMGLVLGDITADEDPGADHFKISKPMPAMLHAGAALQSLEEKKTLSQAEMTQASQSLLGAVRVAPADSAAVKKLRQLASGKTDLPTPRPDKPLKAADALARVVACLQIEESKKLAPEQIKAHPSAQYFPGAAPADARPVEKTVEINLAMPRWHSTGLYAQPGSLITLKTTTPGLSVRIGGHTDHIYHLASWGRAPEISRSFPLASGATKVASPFGGLVYIEVKEGTGTASVVITGTVEAPLYVHGKTTLEQWKTIRNAPGPWAELASSKLILTLPSEAIRKLDDPKAVMDHWDKVLDACATLSGRPIERTSPERMTADVNISAGYMHSGYPIMTHLDVIHAMVDLGKLKSVDSAWGFYHEIGHNHQSSDWTFEGTGEVTVNLFTMYVLETVCGVDAKDATRRALGNQKKIDAYLAAPDFEKWKADPFLALAMYAQLRHEFGWEAYEKVILGYRKTARNRRLDDQAKRDEWMVRFSKQTGKNLGPFFQAWGVPTTEEARKSIADLPVWMPKK